MCCLMVMACISAERMFELYLSARNAAWSRAQGGLEFGQGHLWAMKALHTALIIGCVVETWLTQGSYHRIGTPLAALAVVVAQTLRYWCIATLGQRWNIRVIVIPGLAPVVRGPYAYLAHPNYVAVVLEGFALPMVFGAWRTALLFSVLNAALLWRRITCESQAIAQVCGPYRHTSHRAEHAA